MKRYKGAFSIEAIIVMSSVLIILFAILFAFSLLYQQCLINYCASVSVSEASSDWTQGNELYYQLGEFKKSNVSGKLSDAEKKIKERINSSSVLSGKVDVKADFINSFGGRELKIEVTQDVTVPFEMIARFFNGGKPVQLKATASSKIVEPAEFIRNIDFSTEIASTIADWVKEKLKGIDFIKNASTILGKLK